MHRDDIVAGKVDQAINEAVGDIFPGAHVIIVQHINDPEVGGFWQWDIALSSLTPVQVSDRVLAHPDALDGVISLAESVVSDAKTALLKAWGLDVSDDGEAR